MSTFDEKAIENFREYLRIPTVHPDPDYEPCVIFLTKQARELSLPVQVYRLEPSKPIVIMTWEGTEPELPTILLNSHTDVVPVFEKHWTYPPFDAHMDEKGDIYARGAQDMKCVGTMYLEAIRKLKAQKIQLKRTIHLSFVPDEEIGGKLGMGGFVETEDFKKLNIIFSLDEGAIVPVEHYPVFYGEKAIWQIHVHCPGASSHGSQMAPDSPGDKLRSVINMFLGMRDKMVLKKGPGFFSPDDLTSINLTQVYGGVQDNVVPDKLTAVFDLRIALNENLVEFEAMLNQWCAEAGPGVYMEFKQKESVVQASKMDSNPFWTAFKTTTDKLNLKLKPIICPGNTDSKYLRHVGVSAFGFTPINESPLLLHADDERVNKDLFLKGIRIYCEILPAIANV